MILLAGCKTSEEPREPVAEPVVPAALTAQAVQASSSGEVPVRELTGYDEAGAAGCLPLADGRTCLQRRDQVAQACAAVGGDALVCEDCGTLCSKPLSSQ